MELLAGTQRNGQQQVFKVPTIRIHVPLDQPTVNVNFTALAEEKYGWDALHPVAARLKSLNRYESDEESDSEAAHGEHQPTDGNESAQQPAKKKRKKRREFDYYDVDDPFIDDDELAFQELTAASKDGFFVFQGPLVAEGEKVRIEKSDGTTSKRGGKGTRGRAKSRTAAVSRTPKAKAKESVPDPVTPKAPEISSSEAESPEVSVVAQAVPEKEAAKVEAVPSASEPADPVAVPAQPDASVSPDRMDIDTQAEPAKKRVLSAEVLARRAEKAAQRQAAKLAEKAAQKAEKQALKANLKAEKEARKAARKSQPPATPITSIPASPASPAVASPHIEKKPRKPAREKTVEEKAELAKRARESRERKKAALEAERAALLARAIANPNIDTTAIETAEESKERKKAALEAERAALLARAIANPDIDTTAIEQSLTKETKKELLPSALPPPFDPVKTIPARSFADLSRVDSPSGRSMSLDALLE